MAAMFKTDPGYDDGLVIIARPGEWPKPVRRSSGAFLQYDPAFLELYLREFGAAGGVFHGLKPCRNYHCEKPLGHSGNCEDHIPF